MWKCLSSKDNKEALLARLNALEESLRGEQEYMEHFRRTAVLKDCMWVYSGFGDNRKEAIAAGYSYSHSFKGGELWIKEPKTPKTSSKKAKSKAKSKKKGR